MKKMAGYIWVSQHQVGLQNFSIHSASFLQSIKDKKLNQEELDMYSTIVLYFNSLKTWRINSFS